MPEQMHRDPTFEAACRLEIDEKGCEVCARRMALTTGELRCGVNKVFPFCKGAKKGFVLDMGGVS